MSKTIELLPCPFCGGKVSRATARRSGFDIAFRISCHCGVDFSPLCALEEDCDRAWNKRAATVAAAQNPVLKCSFCDTTDDAGNPWATSFSSEDGKLIYRVAGCKDHKDLVDACVDKIKDLSQK